jgi:hypothetical protein
MPKRKGESMAGQARRLLDRTVKNTPGATDRTDRSDQVASWRAMVPVS